MYRKKSQLLFVFFAGMAIPLIWGRAKRHYLQAGSRAIKGRYRKAQKYASYLYTNYLLALYDMKHVLADIHGELKRLNHFMSPDDSL